jgi:hypothetical protein
MKVQLWHLKQSKNSFPCSSLHSLLPPDTLPKNQTAKVNHTWHGRWFFSRFAFHGVQASLPKNHIPKTLIALGPSLKEQQKLKSQISLLPTPKFFKYLKGTFSIQWYQYPFNFPLFPFILVGKNVCSKSKINLQTKI